MPFAKSEDLEIIKNLAENYYNKAQEIIAKYYLQPFSKSENSTSELPLQNGRIQREIHGGMHVGRAQFYPLIIHATLKALFPEPIKKYLEEIKKILGLDEGAFLTLVRYALLFHDSARKSELTDIYESESADNFSRYFKEQGISYFLYWTFYEALRKKDNPQEFKNFIVESLSQPGSEAVEGLQYLRRLIALSDNIDIMRCTGHFYVSIMLENLSDIPGFSWERHQAPLIELLQHVHRLIQNQSDMLFPCKIILPNKAVYENVTVEARFSLQEKVSYEMAPNVCSVLGEAMRQDPYFASHLLREVFASNPLIASESASWIGTPY